MGPGNTEKQLQFMIDMEATVLTATASYALLLAEEIEKRGITDVKVYFSEEVKKINARMAPYKAVGHIKLRSEEFMKNTSRKITRFNIDKSID